MSVRIAALLAVLAAALTLGGGAGAGTASQPPKKIDLTNPAAVNSYLTSIGINPATVVRQVGLNNYAGPASGCPGLGWNCTTSAKVVQLSSAGGSNKFQCSPGTGTSTGGETTNGTDTCVSVQGGPGQNKAHCKLKSTDTPTASQRCVIEQQGTRNLAIVDQLIEQKAGFDQTATQTADVQQTADEKNEAQIHQDVNQDTKTGTVQNQNVLQSAIVNQYASGSENFSHVHQDQDLNASGAADEQNQNTAPPSDAALVKCEPDEGKTTNPNACVNITQSIGGNGGKNDSHLHQNVSERQKTTASSSEQNQESSITGVTAHIDQTNPAGIGTNRKTAHQDVRQRQEGGTDQNQRIDPKCCGVGTTTGGANNTDNIDQTAIQSASSGAAANQFLSIIGDTNHVPGFSPDFASAATSSASGDVCRFSHKASNNSDSSHESFTVNPCTGPIVVTTTCSSGGESDIAAAAPSADAGDCETIGPGPPEITASSPTFGNPIDPPNFGEPSDFPGPIFPGI
jgi:hypothetical protein